VCNIAVKHLFGTYSDLYGLCRGSTEPKGGSNLYNYKLIESDGNLKLELRLLATENSDLIETTPEIRLSPSNQLANPQVTTDRKQKIDFRVAHQSMTAMLKGSDIIFDRRHLENRTGELLEEGDIGSVWFKLVLDVDSQAPDTWLDGRGRVATPPSVHHFISSLSTTSKHHKSLEPGLRVLSVDMGMRTFASCSVFELVKDQPSNGLYFLADEPKQLWAKHERSFLLSLPGEYPSIKARTARFDANQELRSLRRRIGQLKSVLRLTVKDDRIDRKNAISDVLENLRKEDEDGGDISAEVKISELLPLIDSSPEEWHNHVQAIYYYMEQTYPLIR